MAVKKAPKAQTGDKIGAVETYNILQRRQINEDRIVVERTNMFLLATAFLFVAFVILLDPEWEGRIFTVLRFVLPLLGILLTFLLYLFNRNAIKALAFWHDAQCDLERNAPEFVYMRENRLGPHLERFEFKKDNKDEETSEHKKRPSGTRPIYKYYLPLTFLALWLVALVLVIVS